MSLRKHRNIFKLQKNAIVFNVLETIFVFATHNETTIKEDVTYFQCTNYRMEVFIVCIIQIYHKSFFVHHFILETTKSWKQ